jgi:hypothetical protein
MPDGAPVDAHTLRVRAIDDRHYYGGTNHPLRVPVAMPPPMSPANAEDTSRAAVTWRAHGRHATARRCRHACRHIRRQNDGRNHLHGTTGFNAIGRAEQFLPATSAGSS